MTLAALRIDDAGSWGSASRFKHPKTGVSIAKVLPGYYYLTSRDEMINTVLGSCVCACVRDPIAIIGGMNHFMLPGTMSDYDHQSNNTRSDFANRYGQHAMDNLLEDLVRQGCSPENFEVKLFGGGNVTGISSDVGAENAAFALRYFESKGLQVASSSLGDDFPRKVNYSPITGRVKMMKLRGAYNGLVTSAESAACALPGFSD